MDKLSLPYPTVVYRCSYSGVILQLFINSTVNVSRENQNAQPFMLVENLDLKHPKICDHRIHQKWCWLGGGERGNWNWNAGCRCVSYTW